MLTNIKNFSIDKLNSLFRSLKPLSVSPAVAPIAVVLVGLILHSSFSVKADTEVIYGGPSSDETGVFNVVHAAEAVAMNQAGFGVDEIDGEVGPVVDMFGSASVERISPFGASINQNTDGGQSLYRIKPGETFYSIADGLGLDVKELMVANKKVGEPLIVGDELVIPVQRVPVLTGTDSRRVAGSYLPVGFRWPALGKIGPAHGRFEARDIPNALGSSIFASGPGTVVAADYGWMGGFGNRVIIDHGNGLHTLYGHLNDLVVTIGQTVKEGEVIGFMGSTGRSTGSHVHFEVRWEL